MPVSEVSNLGVPKIIINDTIKLFFNCNQHFVNFKPVSECCVKKIASVYFVRKIYLYFSIGNGQPRETALCQLYRHTFVPYKTRQLYESVFGFHVV